MLLYKWHHNIAYARAVYSETIRFCWNDDDGIVVGSSSGVFNEMHIKHAGMMMMSMMTPLVTSCSTLLAELSIMYAQ